MGGQYAYLREAYSPQVAFLYGWVLLLVTQSGGMAAVAVTFARYLGELVPLPLPEAAVAVSGPGRAHRRQLPRRAGRERRAVRS